MNVYTSVSQGLGTLPPHESETAEFKTSLAELKQGLISLVAMLNKHGQADLWFGITPSGKPAGLMANEKTLRDVSQALAAHIEPRLYPEITSVDVAGKTCLCVQATGHQKPYFAHGRAYIRVADEDRQMSARELESLILKSNSTAMRWDNEPSNTALGELSEDKIRRFLERAGLPWDSTANALTKLGLMQGAQIVNAARLFVASFERPSAVAVITPEIALTTPETTPETVSTTPKTAAWLQKNTKERLVQLLSEQPQLSAPTIAAALGIGKDGVKYHLNQLKQTGKLRRLGPTKGGRWEVTEPDSKGKT